jgi:hypothetical protein
MRRKNDSKNRYEMAATTTVSANETTDRDTSIAA